MDKKWLIVIGMVGAAAALLLAGSYFLSSSPAPLAAVKTFFSAVERRDYETAYALFHSDLAQKQSLEEFTDVAKTHFSVFDAAYRRWSTDVEAGSATVEGRLTTQNGSEATVSIQLVEQEGDWQIVGYQIRGESSSVEVGVSP